jgi:hypothetical protein
MTDLKITMNQGDEAKVLQENSLRAYSECITCPHCGKVGFSRSTQTCNIINVIFCVFCPDCWFAWQIFKKKDLNCYDAEHRCTACNQMIANYNACGSP